MEQDTLQKYLQKIAELVLDEEKIVTYKSLSRSFNVHVNTAKQLLYTFLLQQQELSSCNVSANYLLAGSLKDGSYVVAIINENNLNDAYDKFDNITSEHVYSIQKGKAREIEKNNHILYVVDSKLEHRKNWVIKCEETIQESTPEIAHNTQTQTPKEKAESAMIVESEEEIHEKSERKAKEDPVRKQFPRKDKKKQNSISHLFQNHSQRIKSNTQENIDEKSENSKSSGTKVQDSSRNVDGIDLKEMSITEEEPKVTGKPMNKSKKGVAKKKSKIVNGSKKRKRIISDSEESESDEEKQDALLCLEPESPGNTVRLRMSDDEDDDGCLHLHKKKKKKIVDVTRVDKDGYMETVKEVVYKTDSEDESQMRKNEIKMNENKEFPKSSKPEENTKRGAAAPKDTAKKQKTLLSFFKKN